MKVLVPRLIGEGGIVRIEVATGKHLERVARGKVDLTPARRSRAAITPAAAAPY